MTENNRIGIFSKRSIENIHILCKYTIVDMYNTSFDSELLKLGQNEKKNHPIRYCVTVAPSGLERRTKMARTRKRP